LTNGVSVSLEELKWKYTIDQVYLLYERCIRRSMEQDKMQAIILANTMSYVSPHKDKQGAAKSEKLWRKFLDTLDWTKQRDKKKVQSKDNIVKAFRGAKIPVQKG
jgi:hypothetical protein